MPQDNSLKSFARDSIAAISGAALGSVIANKVTENPAMTAAATFAGAALGLYNNRQSEKAGYKRASSVAAEAISGAALIAYGLGQDIEQRRSTERSAEREQRAFTEGQLDATLQIAESLSQPPANRNEQRQERDDNQIPAFLRRNPPAANVGIDSNDDNSRTFADEVLRQRGQAFQQADNQRNASSSNSNSREDNDMQNNQPSQSQVRQNNSRSSLDKLRGTTDPDSPMSEQNFRPLEAGEPDQPRPTTPPVEELSTEGPDKGKFVRSLSSGSISSSQSR